jgi:altronate dehydratase
VKSVLVISDRDNVATALEPLDPGRIIATPAGDVVVRDPIPSGHKVALQPIAEGQQVIKYGSPIGIASTAIAVGAHVHTHNLESSRGRGDLHDPESRAEPRLAEPPDDDSTPSGVAQGAREPGRVGRSSYSAGDRLGDHE